MSTSTKFEVEIIDATELAKRLCLFLPDGAPNKNWVHEHIRAREPDPIPFFKFGKYARFHWNSPEMLAWLDRQKKGGK